MPASDTIKQPVARYQAVSIRRSIPNSSPGSVIPQAVARIDQMVFDPISPRHFTFRPQGWQFVCLDARLSLAAERDGFSVIRKICGMRITPSRTYEAGREIKI